LFAFCRVLYGSALATPSNRRMKTVERWGDDRFVRMVSSKKPKHSVILKSTRSQLMRKVVIRQRLRHVLAANVLLVGWLVGTEGSAAAQTYYPREYAEVDEILGLPTVNEMQVGAIRLWLTLHLAGSGFLFILPPEESPDSGLLYKWWPRPYHQRIYAPPYDADCDDPRVSDTIGVCSVEWPVSLPLSSLRARLVGAGLFPVPDTVRLRKRFAPCPDDGWHLWVQLKRRDRAQTIEWCIHEYVWPDEGIPRRVVDILHQLTQATLPSNTRMKLSNAGGTVH